MEIQPIIIISVISAAVIAVMIGGYFGVRFVYRKREHRRWVARELANHKRITTELRERLEGRLAGNLEEAFEEARKERKETERHRIESRVMADHEVEDIEWLFEGDNLRDYYNGTVLVDTGWFDRHAVAKLKEDGDPDERV